MPTALGLIVVAALLLANAFFVAAEFSLVSVDRDRVNADKSYRAQVTAKLLKRLTFHLTGCQMGITAMALLLGFVAEPTIGELLEPLTERIFGESSSEGIAIGLALAIATVLHMVLGEQVPKIFALAKPLGTTLTLSPALRIYSATVYPMVAASNGLANFILRRMKVEPAQQRSNVRNRGDLEAVIRSSGEGGAIDETDVSLLTKSLKFGEKTAMDAIVPRLEVISIDTEASVQDLVSLALDTGHSRFPVASGDLDDVKGVIHIKSAHRIPRTDWSKTKVTDLARDVLAVPETRSLTDLLQDMGRKRSPMAVVIDEHGGTSGILTAEDVLEQIVGSIADEHDEPPEESIESDGEFIFAGSIHIEEVQELCGAPLPEGPYETLGGFVLHKLQRIPKEKEIFNHRGWWVEVMEMDALKIGSVRMTPPSNFLSSQKEEF